MLFVLQNQQKIEYDSSQNLKDNMPNLQNILQSNMNHIDINITKSFKLKTKNKNRLNFKNRIRIQHSVNQNLEQDPSNYVFKTMNQLTLQHNINPATNFKHKRRTLTAHSSLIQSHLHQMHMSKLKSRKSKDFITVDTPYIFVVDIYSFITSN